MTVDPSRYDVLRFWVLGQEKPEVELSALDKAVDKIFNLKPKQPVEYYKRVVVAVRLKKDLKLMLKAFKEVCLSFSVSLFSLNTFNSCPTQKGYKFFFNVNIVKLDINLL